MQQMLVQMPNKKIKTNENNKRTSMKRPLLTNSSKDVNKNKSGSAAKRYKSLLICVVCNGDAYGYNFDAITCESCKAFFRRNAFHPMEKFKCRGNDGHCDVEFNIKKRCQKCRLEKCFNKGMRKEWILSDREKEEKRAKIEERHRLQQIYNNTHERQQLTKRDSKSANDLSLDLSSCINQTLLNNSDWSNIQFLQDCYNEAVKLNQITDISSHPSTQSIESTSDLFRIPLYISSMRLITYIKQINEFHQLNSVDQVYLIKSNLLTICFFHSIFIYDPQTDNYHEHNTNDPLFSGQYWIQTLNKQFHFEMKQLRNDLIDIFPSDDIIIKLVFLILLFSNQLSSNQSSQCLLTDIKSLNIFQAQNVFTDLMYRYCLYQYGSQKAPILFSRYVHKIMKIQQLVDEIKYTIDNYMETTQLSTLMQSILV